MWAQHDKRGALQHEKRAEARTGTGRGQEDEEEEEDEEDEEETQADTHQSQYPLEHSHHNRGTCRKA